MSMSSIEPIGYVCETPPPVNVPPYEGDRYVAVVPDTLDLQERAGLAVNALTGPTDPDADYEIYWAVSFRHRPATMQHDWSDQVQCKFMGALPLMRIASGSMLHPEVEQRWMEVLLRQVGPDGLVYVPQRGRPWGKLWSAFDDGYPVTDQEQMIIPFYNGRILEAVAAYAIRDGGDLWRDTARGIVDGLEFARRWRRS